MKIVLNEVQRNAISWLFSPDNDDGDPAIKDKLFDEPITFKKDRGELVLGGAYLHPDGKWATFHSKDYPQPRDDYGRGTFG